MTQSTVPSPDPRDAIAQAVADWRRQGQALVADLKAQAEHHEEVAAGLRVQLEQVRALMKSDPV